MPDCSYCGESFDSEDAYLAHLETVHEGELGPIDRRRIGDETEEGVGLRGVLLAALVVIPIVVAAYVLFFTGSGSGAAIPTPEQTPSDGRIDEHGTINVTIDGNELDFSRSEFQNAHPKFHFEGGDGDIWHAHREGLTLQYAMWTLGIGLTEDEVIYDGQTYTAENDTVIIEVNGSQVDPTEVMLSGESDPNRADDGDHIRIVAVRE
jgi:hypothetical protein